MRKKIDNLRACILIVFVIIKILENIKGQSSYCSFPVEQIKNKYFDASTLTKTANGYIYKNNSVKQHSFFITDTAFKHYEVFLDGNQEFEYGRVLGQRANSVFINKRKNQKNTDVLTYEPNPDYIFATDGTLENTFDITYNNQKHPFWDFVKCKDTDETIFINKTETKKFPYKEVCYLVKGSYNAKPIKGTKDLNMYGVCFLNDKYYLLVSNEHKNIAKFLMILDRNFKLINTLAIEFADMYDTMGLLCYENEVFIFRKSIGDNLSIHQLNKQNEKFKEVMKETPIELNKLYKLDEHKGILTFWGKEVLLVFDFNTLKLEEIKIANEMFCIAVLIGSDRKVRLLKYAELNANPQNSNVIIKDDTWDFIGQYGDEILLKSDYKKYFTINILTNERRDFIFPKEMSLESNQMFSQKWLILTNDYNCFYHVYNAEKGINNMSFWKKVDFSN
jgi:hypothetical protein